jgi:hypothetical protein
MSGPSPPEDTAVAGVEEVGAEVGTMVDVEEVLM